MTKTSLKAASSVKPADGKPNRAADKPPTPDRAETKIIGAFSLRGSVKVGAGVTTRRHKAKSYYFAEENQEGKIDLYLVNENFVPTDGKLVISKDELLDRYFPEPQMYIERILPGLKQLRRHLACGDRHRERGETYSAQMEYNGALKLDEENARATFGIGLCYLYRGENDKAKKVFERLVELNAAFEEDHKHLFNEFGIGLRKNSLYEEALQYYLKAERLAQKDDHLYFNMARACIEQQRFGDAQKFLSKSLQMNPEFNQAMRALNYLKQNGFIDKDNEV